jgi:UDP-glucose 4-epimerase
MTSHVIFGGRGFIGRHLARRLLEGGERVVCVDRNPFAFDEVQAESCVLDLATASPDTFEQVIGAADVVHHLAWTTIPARANADPLTDAKENLHSTINILEALRRRGGGRLIFASSGGTVYGKPSLVPIPENHSLNPLTAYGVSKVAAEKYCQLYRGLHNIDTRVLRISNPYGAGQNPLRQQGAITTFAYRAINEDPITIWGDGLNARDFIYISDLVDAFVRCSTTDFAGDDDFPLMNIGSGQGSTLRDVIDVIETVANRKLEVDWDTARGFDVRSNILDIDAAGKRLSWRPRISLNNGIAQVMADLRERPGRAFSSDL